MPEKLIIGSSQGTLGDSMFLTPVLRAFPGSTLKLFDNYHCRNNIAPIYEGLVSEIIFTNDPGTPPTTYDFTHKTQRMLNALEAPEKSIIPYMEIREEEVAWAKEFLKPYDNPIVIVNQNSGWKDPENTLAHNTKVPSQIMQVIADYYRTVGKYTILQFGTNPNYMRPGYDNFDPLEQAFHFRGLTLRQQAACYKVIGKMITGDTGDPYLMLAAGGKFIMLLTEGVYVEKTEHNISPHVDFKYTFNLWKGEPVRAKYMLIKDYNDLCADISFDKFDYLNL